MQLNDLEIEEYRSLRTSIDMHMKLIVQILFFMVVITSGLLGYAISSDNPIVFLSPILIITPSIYLIKSQMDEVLRKGAYLKVNYEEKFGDENPEWESKLYRYRKDRKGKAGDIMGIFWLSWLLAILCLVGFILKVMGMQPEESVFIVYIIFSLIFGGLLSYLYWHWLSDEYTYKKEKMYIDKFKKK